MTPLTNLYGKVAIFALTLAFTFTNISYAAPFLSEAPFSYELPGVPISNVDTNPATIVTIVVPDDGTVGSIDDLNVAIEITDEDPNNQFTKDLTFTLTHLESGVFTQLSTSNDTFPNPTAPFDVVFDDESLNPYYGGTAGATTGDFQPFSPLSVFDGVALAGTWQLSIQDNIFANEGNDLVFFAISGTQTIPEPASVAVWGLIACGLMAIRRYRRKK
jgi:subtilisin-like proprotein convertase family protein